MKIIGQFSDNEYPNNGVSHIRNISRGVIYNSEGKIAILKLYSEDIFGVRDCYELPGGGIGLNETPVEALKREMKEEIGAIIEGIEEIGEVDDFYNLIQRENHNFYYLARFKEQTNRKLEEYEKSMITNILWVDIDTAIELFTNKMFGGVGKLVKQRELPVLLEAKKMMSEK